MLISEAIAHYLDYLVYRRGATSATLVTYTSVLGQFVYIVGDKEVSDLTLSAVDRYAELLALRGYKPKTYRNKLTIVRSFVRHLYAKELSNIRPESIELPPERQTEASYLTSDEKDRLLEAAKDHPRDYAMLHVLISSGVRVSELRNLKISDIFRRSVSVKRGKGQKYRVTFISHEAEEAIQAYLKQRHPSAEDYLFPNPAGNHLSRVVVAKRVRLYATKASLQKRVTVHTLRHTFATLYLDSGGRIEDLQQILGHSDLKTTMLYLHFTNERLHHAYDSVMSVK